ncbi:MAG: hypothetical protein ACR2J1_10535 [Methyloceanibacter sp.]|uniref:hypothetical protein n=1 Tax=Methyloceanibacter sp. TaxID=1965321 RepID=UPI003D9B6144
MALPKIALRGRKVILLSGYKRSVAKDADTDTEFGTVTISAKDKLRKAAQQDPDAVAFGYVRGEWVASA